MTGTTIAQAIPLAISPILTRIYSPEDFGVFALFFAISSIFGSIVNARYELAILLPKKDEDAINVFALGFVVTSIISLFLLIIIVLFHDYFVIHLGSKEMEGWLYLVPVAVFFTGLFNILNYFNTRKKMYKDIASATIIKSIIMSICQLSIGFLKTGASGLISGLLFSQIFANMRLLKNIIKDKILISKISKVKMMALAKKYKDFPKFSMPAALLNILSHQLTNIFISLFYSVATLGFYSLVQRTLGMPSALIGNSIGQVFFQEATKERQKTGNAIITFNHTVKKLIIIGIPSFGILFLIVEDLFAFVFGEDWRIAGSYARIVMPLFAIRFVVSTISTIITVFEQQKISLYINLLLLISVVLIFVFFRNTGFENILAYLSGLLVVEYTLFFMYFYALSKGSK